MSFEKAESTEKQFVSSFTWTIENPNRLKTKSNYSFETETIKVGSTPFFWYAKLGEDPKDPENSKRLRLDVFLNQVPGTSTTLSSIVTLMYDYEVAIPRTNQETKVMSLWKRPVHTANKSFLHLGKMRHLDFLLTEGVLILEIKLRIGDGESDLFAPIEPETKQKHAGRRSDEHITNLTSDLGKLLETGFMSDVTITIDEEEFKVHKSILAARSEVFRRNFEQAEEVNFSIDNCSIDTFKPFLKFIYTAEFKPQEVDLLEMFALAGKFRVKDLGSLCSMNLRHHAMRHDEI